MPHRHQIDLTRTKLIIMRRITLQLLLLFSLSTVFAQDTTWVQTLTFDSITTRRGIWQFPENEQYRKVLMYYNLKCDHATTHDNFPCGEWDYLTYTNIYDHTGVMDSILYHQPNFSYINGQLVDTLGVRYSPTYEYYRNHHQYPVFNDTISLLDVQVGEGTSMNSQIFDLQFTDGRSQYLWKAEELSNAGFTQGTITGIKLFLEPAGQEIRHFTVKLGETQVDQITPVTIIPALDTVYYNALNVSEADWYSINFVEPFEWDGESNVIIEFAFENDQLDQAINIKSDEIDWDCGVTNATTDYALDLDGEMDFVDLEDAVYFNNDFTFEAWIKKESDNNWSRIFDIGNGAGKDNIIVALSKGTTGRIHVSVRRNNSERHMTLNDTLPPNEWVHFALSLDGIIGRLYINGEMEKIGPLLAPDSVVREKAYIGKSNWNNDGYADLKIDEFRIYSEKRSDEEIKADMLSPIDAPGQDESLVVYYDFNDPDSYLINDLSGNERNGQAFGLPSFYRIKGPELFSGFVQNNLRPQIIFERIESGNTDVVSNMVMDSIAMAPVQLLLFEYSDDPTVPADTLTCWREGYSYVYENYVVVDSVFNSLDEQLIKEDIPYYGEAFEIINPIELARFITPYGINLDLGANGFTWAYDVTDFVHLLKGSVDISAGNQQELIDLKFAFIEGTPPRDMIKLDTIWGYKRSYRYDKLANDEVLSARTIDLEEGAERYKVITRLTGHGHQSSTGDFPHCCEWKDNTHYFYVDGQEAANWHIFQYNDCALNPVYPQGGTWVGAREGWCPGDVVKDFEFDITDRVTALDVTLDYDITDVPEDNPGMGSGNYVTSMYLAQYGPANFQFDAEVYDVVTPNKWEYYSRKNPICSDPQIIIRNNGEDKLNSLKITYGVSGGNQLVYEWEGALNPMQKELVTLPASTADFWLGDIQRIFTVTVSEPNGNTDEYDANNTFSTSFEMPDLYEENFILNLKMNKQPERFHLTIKNELNEVVYTIDEFFADSVYFEQLQLSKGCYTLELLDDENIGLSYWAYPEQGSGYLYFYDQEGNRIKAFENEFGRSIRYAFRIVDETYIQEPNLDIVMEVFPNPCSSVVKLRTDMLQGDLLIEIFDIQGHLIYSKNQFITNVMDENVDISAWNSGVYMVVIHSGKDVIKKRLVVQH